MIQIRRALIRTVLLVAIHWFESAVFLGAEDARGTKRILESQSRHLGLADAREWSDLDGRPPDDASSTVHFRARANAGEATLLIRQREVRLRWRVALNNQVLGDLELNESSLQCALPVPPNVLREGDNTLEIRSPGKPDDIFVDEIALDERPKAAVLGEALVQVRVAADGPVSQGLPCRLTIVDERGCLAPLAVAPGAPLAVRPGVIYTGDGRADFTLPAGTYTCHATRGFAYGLATSRLVLAPGQKTDLALKLAREVDTRGMVACDTHVHSREFSGHGDATADERALTLAGEGIMLAIGTDHNRFADYSEAARRMHVDRFFTCAVGNEVTTQVGHFNVFPVSDPHAPVPDFKLTDWSPLMRSMLAVPGVQIVILNHPRDTYFNFAPFGPGNFNDVTGNPRMKFSFDAVEVANSGTPQSDFMLSYRDWFALLNHGYRATAVGSSDSHDVARHTVGQSRSYLYCRADDPARVSLEEACRCIKEGRVAVSQGLLAKLDVNGRFEPGDLAKGLGDEVNVSVTVLAPSWIKAEKVELFANGVKLREERIATPDAAGVNARIEWTLPKPRHDTYLVAIASGPGLNAPYWPIPFPHQPVNRVRDPHVVGSTNPVWLDADDDGKFTSARDYAARWVRRAKADPAELLPALAGYDESVAAQAAELCKDAGCDVRGAAFAKGLQSAVDQVRRGFAAFTATLAK